MSIECAIQILKMNEQEKWRSGITVEEEKEAIDMAINALQRWCKFKSEKNCDFCAFHSDCEIHWKSGDK